MNKMNSIIFVILINLLFYTSYAQSLEEINTDTLNTRNERCRKDGYWIELVDEKLRTIKCKKKAKFFKFVYFDNSFKVGQGKRSFLPFEKTKLKVDGNDLQEGKIILLNGKYRVYDKYDKLKFEESYIMGKKSGQHIAYKKNGRIAELLDYTKKYEEQEHSFLILGNEQEDGSFKYKAYYRKGEGGWGIYTEE